jgi:hypothetical protein
MTLFPNHTHRIIHITGLGLIALFIPLSVFMISVGVFTLIINWVITPSLYEKWQQLKQNRSLQIYLIILPVYLVGLIKTQNFNTAFAKLQIGLPLFLIPLAIGTSPNLNKIEIRKILIAFITGCFASSIYSFYKILTIHGNILEHMNEISPFIFHIRLAICVVTSLVFLPWIYKSLKGKTAKIVIAFIGLWFLIFLLIFQSLTGLVILFFIILIFIIIQIFKTKDILIKWGAIVLGITFILTVVSGTFKFYLYNFSPRPLKTAQLEKLTLHGHPYFHDTTSYWIENGRFVNTYICNYELNKEWAIRSKFNINGNDKEGNKLYYTLTRYLTSKDFTKDSAGIWQLSDNDIANIENGISNPLYINSNGIKARTYRAMWEIYHYKHGSSPEGYSIPQRIEYHKTAFHLIKNNLWFGVGIGDEQDELDAQFKKDHSQLPEPLKLNVHNQFLTYTLEFGIMGLIFIILAIFAPPAISKKYNSYLFSTFLIISILSMFSIDLLEKHAGISFFSLFYSIFLFGNTDFSDISPERNQD